MNKNSEIKALTKKINKWIDERGWEKFQAPKDLAISITLEASEVLEHFQWKKDAEVKKHVKDNKEEVADELADVAIYLLKLADKINVDLGTAIENKLIKQAKKYPAGSAIGKDLQKSNQLRGLHKKKKIAVK